MRPRIFAEASLSTSRVLGMFRGLLRNLPERRLWPASGWPTYKYVERRKAGCELSPSCNLRSWPGSRLLVPAIGIIWTAKGPGPQTRWVSDTPSCCAAVYRQVPGFRGGQVFRSQKAPYGMIQLSLADQIAIVGGRWLSQHGFRTATPPKSEASCTSQN